MSKHDEAAVWASKHDEDAAWRAFCDFAENPNSAADPREPWEVPPTSKPKTKPIKSPATVGNALQPAREAAARLQITVEQLFEFVRLGELRFVNVGRGSKRPRYRFAEPDLQEFIERRKQQDIPCPSSRPPSPRRISGSTSNYAVVGFTALRAAHLAKKPKK